MSSSISDQEWDRHRSTLWQLWVRDRLPLKDLRDQMQTLGVVAKPAEYAARFKLWGFSQNIPVETWKYVGYQVKKRKRQGYDSDVLISGVRIHPKKVRKETSRHFYDSMTLSRTSNPAPPAHPWVSVCSPASVSLSFKWRPSMPWIQISRHLPFPRFFFDQSYQTTQEYDFAISTLALNRYAGFMNRFHLTADPSQIAQRLAALMPESFQGEHILYSQSIISGIQGTKLLAARLCLYRMLNGFRVEDKNILDLVDQLSLTETIRDSYNPILKEITSLVILSSLAGAALRQGRPDILAWVLKLNAGVSPTTRQKGGFLNQEGRQFREESTHFPLSLLLQDLLQQRHLIHAKWEAMLQLLLDHTDTTSISVPCCQKHGTVLETATTFQDPTIMTLIINRGFELQGRAYLESLDWKALFCGATRQSSPDTGIGDGSPFSYLLSLHNSAYQTGLSPLHMFMYPDALVQAARFGGVALIRHLGRLGANFNCFDQNAESPLGAVVSRSFFFPPNVCPKRRARICQELLNFGALPDLQNLVLASQSRPRALHRAVSNGQLAPCKMLLQRGDNPNTLEIYRRCETTSNYRCTEPSPGTTGLDLCLDVDSRRCDHEVLATPLQYCVSKECDPEMVLLLLEYGAVMQDDDLLRFISRCPFWPTIYESRNDYEERNIETVVVRVAASRNYHPNQFSLHLATRSGDFKTARSLIQVGALVVTEKESGRLNDAFGPAFPDLVVHAFFAGRIGITDCLEILKCHCASYPGHGLLEASVAKLISSKHHSRSQHEAIVSLRAVLDSYPLVYSSHAIVSIIYELLSEIEYRNARDNNPDVLDITNHIITRRPGTYTSPRRIDYLQWEFWFPRDGCSDLSMAAVFAIETGNFELLDIMLSTPVPTLFGTGPSVNDPFYMLWWDEFSSESISVTRHRRSAAIDKLVDAGYKTTTLSGLAATSSVVALISEVERLIDLGFDPQRRYNWSATALQYATENQNIEMVRFLLNHGVDVNAPPAWHFHDLAAQFSAKGDETERRTALQFAVECANLELIQALLDAGADVNAPPARYAGATALQLACINGDVGITKWLISLGADVNADGAVTLGRTALEGASEHGRLDTVQLLIDEGCSLTGAGRRQFINAVRRAQQGGHDQLAAHLQRVGYWTEDDERQLNDIDQKDESWDHSSCCDADESVDGSTNEPRCWEFTDHRTNLDIEDEPGSSQWPQPPRVPPVIPQSYEFTGPPGTWNQFAPPATNTFPDGDVGMTGFPGVQESAESFILDWTNTQGLGELDASFEIGNEFGNHQEPWAWGSFGNDVIEDVTEMYET